MRKCDVHTPEQALAYITDCNLATVSHMAMLKSKSKSEFERQIKIAESGVNWMVEMKIKLTGTRADDVVKAGGVKKWVELQSLKVNGK